MPRRVSLPGAAELFRPTQDPADDVGREPSDPGSSTVTGLDSVRRITDQRDAGTDPGAAQSSTGRVRHDEKITVYVSTDELLALEQTRLLLRAEHETAVDRGRIVREAVSMALEDFATHGADSPLVRRLTAS